MRGSSPAWNQRPQRARSKEPRSSPPQRFTRPRRDMRGSLGRALRGPAARGNLTIRAELLDPRPRATACEMRTKSTLRLKKTGRQAAASEDTCSRASGHLTLPREASRATMARVCRQAWGTHQREAAASRGHGKPSVSRYFKYKTRQCSWTTHEAMGLEVRLQEDLALLRDTGLGRRAGSVGNRLAIQPMEGCDANLDGTPSELTLRRYRRFGGGGAKLIWGEACAVVTEGRANPRQLLIEEATAPALDGLLQLCRRAHVEACGSDSDLLVGLQLTHSGRYSCQRPVLAQHDPLLDPRTVIDRSSGRPATRSIR